MVERVVAIGDTEVSSPEMGAIDVASTHRFNLTLIAFKFNRRTIVIFRLLNSNGGKQWSIPLWRRRWCIFIS